MARMHALEAIHHGRVVLMLLTVVAVMFLMDYHFNEVDVYRASTLTDHSDELSHISKVKRGKALSYIENPYGQADD
ncbi:MAG: hypothetical protein AAGG81_00255 [Chlamydiota bacterium]